MSLRCNLIALRLNFTEEQGLPSPVASSPRRITITYFESSCGGEQYNQGIRPHTNLSWAVLLRQNTKKLSMASPFESEFIEPEIAVANSPCHKQSGKRSPNGVRGDHRRRPDSALKRIEADFRLAVAERFVART